MVPFSRFGQNASHFTDTNGLARAIQIKPEYGNYGIQP